MRPGLIVVAVCLLSLFLAPPVHAAPVYHEIRKGETLYGIARTYKVPYEAIAAANGITDPAKVRTGDSIISPDLYTVESGDTLIGIARRYGTTAQHIRDANRLTATAIIKPGDLLVIPGSATRGTPVSGQAVPSSTVPSGTAPSGTSGTTAASSTTTTTAMPQAPARVSSSSTSTSTNPPSAQSSPVTTARPVQPSGTVTGTSLTGSTSTTTVRQPPVPGSGAAQGSTTLPVPSTTTSSAPSAAQVRPSSTHPTLPQDLPMRSGTRQVDRTLSWPTKGEALYLDGRLEGVMIRTFPGESAKAVASGLVVSAGPARGFGLAVFVQSPSGHIYVYGGNDRLSVDTGSRVRSGDEIGRIGIDAKDGGPVAFFFVFKDGESIDPARAPRD